VTDEQPHRRAGRWSGPAPAVVLSLLGAALGLLAASQAWVHATVDDPVLGHTTVTASGRQAAPVVPAVALVALAGGVALLLARTLGRRVAGLLLVLAGAAMAAAAVTVVRSPAGGVGDLVGRAVGTVGGADAVTRLTWWPWLAVAGGVACFAGGALAVVRARGWAASRSRYDAPGEQLVAETGPETAPADDDPGATWDALSRGEDPTR
jgi:uncharacterized membrane protein (TIGR02234 family)